MFSTRVYCDSDYLSIDGTDLMRNKYLKKLLGLIAEMKEDMLDLDQRDRQVYAVLRLLVAAYNFYLMDDFLQYLNEWKMRASRPVIDDGVFLAALGIETEEKEIAAAEAAVAESIEKRIDKILEK